MPGTRRFVAAAAAPVLLAAILAGGARPAVAATGRAAPPAGAALDRAAASAVPPGPAGPSAGGSGTAATSVTLVTGDRIRLLRPPGGQPVLTIEPAPGREHIGFAREAAAGPDGTQDISVLPADAIPLVDAGRLDPRLFDVTGLVRQGFTDASPALPLIVTYARPASPPALRAPAGAPASPPAPLRTPPGAPPAPLRAPAATTVRSLPSIDGLAVRQDKRHGNDFWRWLTGEPGTAAPGTAAAPRALSGSIAKVWLDGIAQPTADGGAAQIGAPAAWAAGYTGTGVTVGMLDTGVKADHPDLAGSVTEAVDFTGTRPDGGDDIGHGTHVAGIIAGTGAASGGTYRGVAPGAKLISGKVCVRYGCPDSAVIAGMEWIAPKVRVVNMSLGGDATDGTDPLSVAVNALTAQYGTLFVAAAGNDRTVPDPANPAGSVVAPGAADAALAVGSVDAQDQTSPFSPLGPRLGDLAVKPDIAAPGSDIVSARAAGTPDGDADPVDANYARMSGTSMAAAYVSGAAAILAQAHPDWDAARLKQALMSTAKPTAGVFEQGAGRVDVARAVGQPVTAATGSLGYGFFPWPHTQAVAKTVTYRNDGAAPVTLTLSVSASRRDGTPAPAGLFTPSAGTVTVPAHGSADVTLTADTGAGGAGAAGLYGGRLTATAPGVAVVTALAISLEPESYNLTVHLVHRAGTTFTDALGRATNVATGQSYGLRPFDASGAVTVRLPRAQYDIEVFDQSVDPANQSQPITVTLMARPGLPLDRDTSLRMDANAGRPVLATVDEPGAQPRFGEYGLASGDAAGTHVSSLSWFFTAPNQQLFAVPTSGAVTGHPFAFFFRDTLAATDPGTDPTATVYQLAFLHRGGIPAGTAYRVPDRSLAEVDSRYAGQGAPVVAQRGDYARLNVPGANLGVIQPYWHTLPSRRTEYFTANPDVIWEEVLGVGAVDLSDAEIDWRVGAYRAGHYRADWNFAPLGPAFGDAADGWGVVRTGNQLSVALTLLSDSDPAHFTSPPLAMTGTTELYRDGVLLGTSPVPGAGAFPIPDTPGVYALHAVATRIVPWSVVGTGADITWTFHEPGAAAAVAPLPLLVVRVRGNIDDQGAAPAGVPFPLTLTVQRQPGAPAAALAGLAVEASFDDGATWQPVPTVRVGQGGVAVVRHPAGDGFVSLRITASDSQGNSVRQTVLRAYRLAAG